MGKTSQHNNIHTAWNTTVALPQRRTQMEIDDDVGRQTCRQMKMETYEDEDRRTLGWSKVAALLQLTTTPEWWRRNLILHLPCDSLTPEPMEDVAVSAAPGPVASFLNLLWEKQITKECRQSPQAVPTGLTRLTTKRFRTTAKTKNTSLFLCSPSQSSLLRAYKLCSVRSFTYLIGWSHETNSWHGLG